MTFGEIVLMLMLLGIMGAMRHFALAWAQHTKREPETVKLAEVKVYLNSVEARQSSANEQRDRVLQIVDGS